MKFVFGKANSTADCAQALTSLCRHLATTTAAGAAEYATLLEDREDPTWDDIPEPPTEEETENDDGTKEKKTVAPDLYKMRLNIHAGRVKQQDKEKKQHKECDARGYALLLQHCPPAEEETLKANPKWDIAKS